MQRIRLVARRALAVVIVAAMAPVVAVATTVSAPDTAAAHGTMQSPPSRSYTCRYLLPNSEMCRAAWDANPQALYDWMEVNIGSAAGRHQELIPDGELCGAGRDKYAAFNTPSSTWPTTPISADADGNYNFDWYATAPHSTDYLRMYVTREGFDVNSPLGWSDLEEVAEFGPYPPQSHFILSTPLPERSGQHIIYVIWQRNDSPEAFYACIDVSFDGDSPPTTAPPTTAPPTTPPPTTAPPTTAPPTTAPPADANADISLDVTTDWGTGYCAQATVSTDSTTPIEWVVSFSIFGSVNDAWNAFATQAGNVVTASGASWNRLVTATRPQSFGFCVNRFEIPPPPPPTTAPPTTAPPTTAPPTTAPPTSAVSHTVEVTSDWGTGYCANVNVSASGSEAIDWSVDIAIDGTVTELWSAFGSQTGSTLTAEGMFWNNLATPGAYPATFGFCAAR